MPALCLLAVGSQPGTIIAAVPYAKHLASHASTSLKADKGREPRRGARSWKVGKPSNQWGCQISPQNKPIKAT